MKPPRIAITGIGVVSAFGAGREVFWDAIRRGQSGTRAITEFDASTYPCKVAAPVPPVDIASAMALEGEPGRARAAPIPSAIHARRCSASIAAREAWNDAGLSFAEPNAGVIIGSGGGGIDVGERAVSGLLPEQRPARHAVCDRRRHLRHGVERDLDRARPARHQPRAVDRLHELDRRARLRGDAAAAGRVRRAAVGRHRRLRAAGHDLRLLAHAGGVDALQRPRRARRRARSISRRDGFVLGEGRVDDGARARGSRPRARRARSTRPSTATRRPATPITASRWIPTASRS